MTHLTSDSVRANAGVMIVVVVHTFRWARMPMLVSACLPEAWRAPANDQLRKLLRGRCAVHATHATAPEESLLDSL